MKQDVVQLCRRGLAIGAAVLGLVGGLIFSGVDASGVSSRALELTPTARVYLPLVVRSEYACPVTSNNAYSRGIAYQFDTDNPVRPAYLHADKNLALRGYVASTDPGLKRELVNYGSGDPTQPPQLATLFRPYRVPAFVDFYRVHNWLWARSPDPGCRGDPITDYAVTAMGLETTPGDVLQVPTSGYDIGGGVEVLLIFADEDSVALRYTREDSSGSPGYTVHVDNICTDPNLLALYAACDEADGPRYEYPNGSYKLPNLSAGKAIGTARGDEVVLAIVDTGSFMDPRSCNEWWQIRPGYPGSCPSPWQAGQLPTAPGVGTGGRHHE